MNVWIFNPYESLPHEGVGRLRYASLSEALIKQGHRVTWWASDWSHSLKKRRAAHSGNSTEDWVDQLSVEWVHVPAYGKNVSLARVWSHRCYARGIERRVEDVTASGGKPDLILFSVPPMEAGSVALKLGRKYGARVVLDVMDAWPDTLLLAAAMTYGKWRMANAIFRGFGHIALWPYSRMMRRYCRGADAICAQSKAFVEYARSFGATVDIPVFHLCAQARAPELSGQGVTSEVLRLIYLGAMGRVYDLSTLVSAVIDLLKQGVPLQLNLIGEGEQRGFLESKVAALGLSKAIQFHGFLEGAELDARMAEADVGVIPMHPESGVAIPYKGPHYLSYGLYVLSSLRGELMDMLWNAQCGDSYTAGDVEALANLIRDLANDPVAVRHSKARVLALFSEHFDRERVHAQMAEWLENLDESVPS